jgi:hypothetical protein
MIEKMFLLAGKRYYLECPTCCIYLLCLCPDSRLWAWSQVTRRLHLWSLPLYHGVSRACCDLSVFCDRYLMLVGAGNRNGSRVAAGGHHVHASFLDSSLVLESGISLNLVCVGMQACLIYWKHQSHNWHVIHLLHSYAFAVLYAWAIMSTSLQFQQTGLLWRPARGHCSE